MNPSNPLESIFYIKVPENFVSSDDAFKIDTSVELPVQKKINEAPGDFNPSEITTEQILAGILTVLAYDKEFKHVRWISTVRNSICSFPCLCYRHFHLLLSVML